MISRSSTRSALSAEVSLLPQNEKPRAQYILMNSDYICSNPCTEEKRNSGIKILEIRISDVSELLRLKDEDVIAGGVSYNLKEGVCERDRLFAAHQSKSIFPCTKEYQLRHSPFIRVSFYQSGETSQKKVLSISDAHDENAVFEITYNSYWSHIVLFSSFVS